MNKIIVFERFDRVRWNNCNGKYVLFNIVVIWYSLNLDFSDLMRDI